jgi:hypothetical protein
VRLAREDHGYIRRPDAIPAVGVAVAVGQQAQPGRGSRFEQRYRLGQSGQDRKQHGPSSAVDS